MRRRSSGVNSDNLELLLDTMCNSFGGVMFIAILMAVLSQVTAVETTDPTVRDAESKRLQQEVERLTRERERIQGSLSNISEVIRDPDDASLKELFRKLKQLKKDNAALVACLDDLKEEGAKLDKKVKDSQQKNGHLRQAIAALKGGIPNAEGGGGGEVRVLRAPRITPSTKSTFFVVVRWNRLYVLRLPSREDPRGTVNSQDVQHSVDGLVERYDPIQGKGVPLDDPLWTSSPTVANILRSVPSARYSLQFAVYPDSYSSFVRVRDFFQGEKGYGWNWFIVPSNAATITVAPGGGSTTEQ